MTMSRRTILRGSSGAVIGLPWLEAMLPRRGFAASAGPRRILFYVTTVNYFPERHYPALPGGPSPPDTPSVLERNRSWVSGRTALDRSDFIISDTLAPLERHRDRLTVVEGLDRPVSMGHPGYTSLLTGNGEVSADQVVATHLGRGTRFPSLQLGTHCWNDGAGPGVVSFYSKGKPAVPENNPYAAFDRVFGEFMAPVSNAYSAGSPRVQAATTEDLHRADRKSVLDAALAQLNLMKPQLSLQDRVRMEEHADAIRQLERVLYPEATGGGSTPVAGGPAGSDASPPTPGDPGGGAAPPPAPPVSATDSCRKPAAPAAGIDWKNSAADIEKVWYAHLALVPYVYACDLSRVVVLQFLDDMSNTPLPWLNISDAHGSEGGHASPFRPEPWKKIVNMNRWHAEQLAALVDRLKAMPEGDGTVFDNTVIVWTPSLKSNPDHDAHNLPVVMLGNAGGFFKTGRYVRYEYPTDDASHRCLNDVMATLIEATTGVRAPFGSTTLFKGHLDNLKA